MQLLLQKHFSVYTSSWKSLLATRRRCAAFRCRWRCKIDGIWDKVCLLVVRRQSKCCGLQERCVNLHCILCRRLEILQRSRTLRLGPLLRAGLWYPPLRFHVHLISKHYEREIIWVRWAGLCNRTRRTISIAIHIESSQQRLLIFTNEDDVCFFRGWVITYVLQEILAPFV